jgi:hypothetical protein
MRINLKKRDDEKFNRVVAQSKGGGARQQGAFFYLDHAGVIAESNHVQDQARNQGIVNQLS